MLRAIESAMSGYVDHAREISRLAVRTASSDQDQVGNVVGLMVNQHAAEASLVVAKVADETARSLLHVIA
jgi:hypothetical protein